MKKKKYTSSPWLVASFFANSSSVFCERAVKSRLNCTSTLNKRRLKHLHADIQVYSFVHTNTHNQNTTALCKGVGFSYRKGGPGWRKEIIHIYALFGLRAVAFVGRFFLLLFVNVCCYVVIHVYLWFLMCFKDVSLSPSHSSSAHAHEKREEKCEL